MSNVLQICILKQRNDNSCFFSASNRDVSGNISSDKSYLSDNAVGTGSFDSALARWNDNGSESNVLINTKDRAEISKFNHLLDLSLKSAEHLTCKFATERQKSSSHAVSSNCIFLS